MARKHVTTRMVLEIFSQPSEGRVERLRALTAASGEPEKVVWSALERDADRGLIEYGVSIISGWLTKDGKTLLSEMRQQSPSDWGRE